MDQQMYCYVNYSPTAITLAIEENWLTLAAATGHLCYSRCFISASAFLQGTTTAPRPSRMTISVVPAASLAPQASRKAATTIP
ncbi:hypothetical protein ACLOJK_028743 [Asimina triloba]